MKAENSLSRIRCQAFRILGFSLGRVLGARVYLEVPGTLQTPTAGLETLLITLTHTPLGCTHASYRLPQVWETL